MVNIKLNKNERQIVKELVDNEQASLKVVSSNKKLPEKLNDYKEDLSSLEQKVEDASTM